MAEYKMGFRQFLIAILTLLAAPAALAAQVTVTVDWPNWAEENTVRIYDATNTTPLTPVFDDGPQSGSNLSFQGSQTYTLADNTDFTLRMTDSYGDGWNGAASVVITMDGTQVLNTTLASGFSGIAAFSTALPTTDDYSDAPTSGTSYGDASHTVASGLQLGAAIDADAGSLANADASGDGADDDGVSFPTLTQGLSATISVEVNQTSANQGYLRAWIDWNGDGVFDDAGEQVATDLQSPAAGTSTINVPVSVPATATTNQTFARFRWSTTAGLDSTIAAPDGEVEDYALAINAGLPPPNYVLDTSDGNACTAQGGTLTGGNYFTDFDGGTFGTGSGAPDESPATNPYPGQFQGGDYDGYYSMGHGEYSIVSNIVTPRNAFQHANGIYDPEIGRASCRERV